MPYSLTPVELLVSGHFDTGVLPPFESTRTTSTTRTFRGSIARPPTSLSTLRRRPYEISPRKTRFRLVANLCRAGFAPAGFHLKGFRFVSYCLHRFPLSQAWPGAQTQALVFGTSSPRRACGSGSIEPAYALANYTGGVMTQRVAVGLTLVNAVVLVVLLSQMETLAAQSAPGVLRGSGL